ncbi:putative GTPase [Roseibacterium elongatum DSM 19469]|uniref:Small ribosomal subunit biogenesis GTPase RsgA n=1 Tax=Roseicyclus elongatus DSM 19469 TaxID=1294273 RepID=W8SKC2_9RHOB|nr:ribosome small subunit-dependent GTPase A [Roseibacterium elongatum]AHM02945.1 putative GTPase [Roseibacterium elongatum DSM 19469]
MVRDYSQFLPNTAENPRTKPASRLGALGWRPGLAQQIAVEDMATTPPVRVMAVHRNGLQVMGDDIETLIPTGPDATVGDWLLFDRDVPSKSRVLRRLSLFKRRAPGTARKVQLIAANIDTAFLVSSCNHDFNTARLERYVALSFEAGAVPVIVLTKTDLCADVARYLAAARAISDRVQVIALNARGDQPAEALADWCKHGQTVAFLGSSGVGKSTLVNGLFHADRAATQAIREDDSKGRHTTTRRELHITPGGCAVLDTPGMRELQLTDARDGIDDVFADIADLATRCKFNDCQHQSEPGCAVLAAVEAGEIDPARLVRWRKLAAEDRFNSATLAERRAGDRSFGKMVRNVKALHRKLGK